MKTFFLNQDEQRLKAGWRILIFMICLAFVSTIAQFLLKSIIGGMPPKGILRDFTAVALAALASTIVVPLITKYISKRSFISLGYRWNNKAVKDLVFGFALSAAMAALFTFLLYLFGLIEINGINWESNSSSIFIESLLVMSLSSISFLFLLHILVGWWEELVFRAFIFQNMVEGMGTKAAILISCLIYGVVHAFNPNAGILSSLIIVLFGYLRIYGLLSTKMMWLSIGMHIGWNFFQGPIFGFSASGHKTAQLLSHSVKGPEYLSGGEFGPEGSLIMIPIIIFALLAMKWWSKQAR